MVSYPIERWDVVQFDNSIIKYPMIYIKPDSAFLDFAGAHDYKVVAVISGTGRDYDGPHISGVVEGSGNVPNCRPNYYAKTGYYVITLDSSWSGYPYPTQLGSVSFLGLNPKPAPKKEENKTTEKFEPKPELSEPTKERMPTKLVKSGDDNKKKGLPLWAIVIVILGVAGIFLLLCFLTKSSNKSPK